MRTDCLVAIHPFSDGNGRVARALASAFTYRGAGVPLLLFSDERDAYLDTLAEADRGSAEVFIRLLADATVASIALVAAELHAGQAPAPSATVRTLRTLLTAHGGLPATEIDRIANRLLDRFAQEMNAVIVEVEPLEGMRADASVMGGTTSSPPEGFRRPANRSLLVSVNSAPPVAGQQEVRFEVFVARELDDLELFWLLAGGTHLDSRFTLREVDPEVSVGAALRLKALARRTFGDLIEQLRLSAENSFQASEYSPPA